MSFELGESVRRCGLESGGRRDLLEALATYADDETGLATVSQLSLALHAGLTERHARRILTQLVSDARLEGLVRLVAPPRGRGRSAVYRLHLERVEPLAAAVKIAQRACHAGAAKALMAAGLVGAPLSPQNMRRVFGRLRSLCEAEGQAPAAAAIAAQAALFEAALAAEAPGRLADGSELPFGSLAPRPAAACGKPVEKRRGNPDILSRNPDILSGPHNKDTSPSRINPLSRPEAREGAVEDAPLPGGPESAPQPAPAPGESPAGFQGVCEAGAAVPTSQAALHKRPETGKSLISASTVPGGFLIDPEAMLGHLQGGREVVRAFLEAFRHRPARVTPEGVLAVTASGEKEAFRLARDWLDPLLAWAAESGLSGVVFEAHPPQGPP